MRNGPTPSKRLNIRGLIRGDINNPYRVHRNTEKADTPHISIVVDGSTSMNGGFGGITPDDVTMFSPLGATHGAGYPASAEESNDPYGRILLKPFRSREEAGAVAVSENRPTHTYNANAAETNGVPPNAMSAARAGRVLVRALDILAKKGILTAKVYLSGSGGKHGEFSLPCRDESQFKQLRGFSGEEGISETLSPRKGPRSAFHEIARNGRLVLVWTDGNITDEPLNREALRERGLYTVGMLASLHNNTGEMSKHFDSSICRTSLFATASALVRLIKSGATKKAPSLTGALAGE